MNRLATMTLNTRFLSETRQKKAGGVVFAARHLSLSNSNSARSPVSLLSCAWRASSLMCPDAKDRSFFISVRALALSARERTAVHRPDPSWSAYFLFVDEPSSMHTAMMSPKLRLSAMRGTCGSAVPRTSYLSKKNKKILFFLSRGGAKMLPWLRSIDRRGG
jgi:hypothetical protein